MYMYDLWTWTKRGIVGGKGDTGQRGAKGENWNNCNDIINKIYLKKPTRQNEISNVKSLESESSILYSKL